MATLASHRVATDAPLVRPGAARAVVQAAVVSARPATLLELEINPGRANRARLNRSPVPRPRDVLGVLRTVLFAPEDLAMVKGDPPSGAASSTTSWWRGPPGWPGCAPTTSGCSSSAAALLQVRRRRPAGRGGGGGDLRTLEVWDGHLASARRASCWRPGWSWCGRCARCVGKAYAELAPASGRLALEYRQLRRGSDS